VGEGLVDQEAVELGLALDEPEVGADGALEELLAVRVVAEEGLVDLAEEAVGEALGDGGDEPVAVPEVAVEDRLGDPASAGQLVHRDAGAPLADRRDGVLQELVAADRPALVALRPVLGSGRHGAHDATAGPSGAPGLGGQSPATLQS
jgi:hypothetical protein